MRDNVNLAEILTQETGVKWDPWVWPGEPKGSWSIALLAGLPDGVEVRASIITPDNSREGRRKGAHLVRQIDRFCQCELVLNLFGSRFVSRTSDDDERLVFLVGLAKSVIRLLLPPRSP